MVLPNCIPSLMKLTWQSPNKNVSRHWSRSEQSFGRSDQDFRHVIDIADSSKILFTSVTSKVTFKILVKSLISDIHMRPCLSVSWGVIVSVWFADKVRLQDQKVTELIKIISPSLIIWTKLMKRVLYTGCVCWSHNNPCLFSKLILSLHTSGVSPWWCIYWPNC